MVFSSCGVASSLRRKGCIIFLAFYFLIGFLFGLLSYTQIEEPAFSWMRRDLFSATSIIGFLSASLLPFLLSVIAVKSSKHWLIYLICFLEAFLFSYASAFIILSFQPIGFFIRSLLLFGDCISLPVLFFYWIRGLLYDFTACFSHLFSFLSIGFLIGCIDLYVFSTFCLV